MTRQLGQSRSVAQEDRRLWQTRVLLMLGLLLGWQVLSLFGSKFWMSSPVAVAQQLWRWIADGSLFFHVWATVQAAGYGYLIGTVLGCLTGLILGLMPRVDRIFQPFIIALYSLPKIALAPVFVILFGIELSSKVILVAITVFFLLLFSTRDGVRDVDQELIVAVKLMGASQIELAQKILLPASMPWIFSGLRLSVRYAFTAAILAEFIAANEGLGFLIEHSAVEFNTTGVFAALTVLVMLSVLINELLARGESSALGWRV